MKLFLLKTLRTLRSPSGDCVVGAVGATVMAAEAQTLEGQAETDARLMARVYGGILLGDDA